MEPSPVVRQINNLLIEWMSLPETEVFIKSALEQVKRDEAPMSPLSRKPTSLNIVSPSSSPSAKPRELRPENPSIASKSPRTAPAVFLPDEEVSVSPEKLVFIGSPKKASQNRSPRAAGFVHSEGSPPSPKSAAPRSPRTKGSNRSPNGSPTKSPSSIFSPGRVPSLKSISPVRGGFLKLSVNDHGIGSPPRSPSTHGRTQSNFLSPQSHRKHYRTFSNQSLASIEGLDVPAFYFPNGPPLDPDEAKKIRALVDDCFDDRDGLTAPMLIPVTTQVCGLSSYLTNTLYKRITGRAHDSGAIADAGTLVTQEAFLKFWDSELVCVEPNARLFRILCAPGAKHLCRADFKDLVKEIVGRHPGLDFLAATPEFQTRYAETVIARIFYTVNRAGDDKLTLRDLKKSNLLLRLAELDNEEDINKINDYFSYEHFYVIYCKFWELDSDHDSYLDREDLLRYDDYALSPACVDRIMSGTARKLMSQEPLKMNYLDFVVFLISEVDKTSDVALDYWFRVLDLDMDDVVSTFEIDFFFCEQQARMREAEQEDVLTKDIVCQLIDAVAPLDMTRITRADLRQTCLAPLFFDCLFNMNKFVASESRDAVRIRQMHATPQLCEWDRFAIAGYYQLADEPDEDEGELYEDEEYSDGDDNVRDAEHINEEEYSEDFDAEMRVEASIINC